MKTIAVTRTKDTRNKHALAADVLSNGYFVSTIDREGNPDLRPLDDTIGMIQALLGDDERADLSSPGKYETMVFSCDPESGEVLDWTELDFARYGTEDAAREGHEAHVSKWMQR